MSPQSGFYGFRRPDGRVGVRNHVLVVPTVVCSAVVTERIAAAVPGAVALPHLAGCGQLGPDMQVTHDTLAAYCQHPNVAAVLVVALGCEQVVAYTASKAGVAGITRALAVEWASHGVTVNAIAPGVFQTDLNRELLKSGRGEEFLVRTPMKRFGNVDELVGAAVFLASDASGFVTGQLIAVDGGLLASGVNQ